MDLHSCSSCGVVLDFDHIATPRIHDFETGELLESCSAWDGEKYVPKVECPVCACDIMMHWA